MRALIAMYHVGRCNQVGNNDVESKSRKTSINPLLKEINFEIESSQISMNQHHITNHPFFLFPVYSLQKKELISNSKRKQM